MRKGKQLFMVKNPKIWQVKGALPGLEQRGMSGGRTRSPIKAGTPQNPALGCGRETTEGEKGQNWGGKKGFWLILVISKRLWRQQFRNSWWGTNSSSFKSLMEVEPRKTGVKSRGKCASTACWKRPKALRAAQNERSGLGSRAAACLGDTRGHGATVPSESRPWG